MQLVNPFDTPFLTRSPEEMTRSGARPDAAIFENKNFSTNTST